SGADVTEGSFDGPCAAPGRNMAGRGAAGRAGTESADFDPVRALGMAVGRANLTAGGIGTGASSGALVSSASTFESFAGRAESACRLGRGSGMSNPLSAANWPVLAPVGQVPNANPHAERTGAGPDVIADAGRLPARGGALACAPAPAG